MAKILVVDDDTLLANMIADFLRAQQYTIEVVYNGADAEELLSNYHYDAVVIDWGLPEKTGIEVVKKFRFEGGTSPVLMLTGRDTIDEKETGLDNGADDYLTKPFHMKELSARLRALLRRMAPSKKPTLEAGDLSLDPVAHKVTRGGEELSLHPREFALLEHLMRNPNQVFSAENLLDRVWKSDSSVGPEGVRASIKRLRKKVDVEGKESVIETVYGVGYKLTIE